MVSSISVRNEKHGNVTRGGNQAIRQGRYERGTAVIKTTKELVDVKGDYFTQTCNEINRNASIIKTLIDAGWSVKTIFLDVDLSNPAFTTAFEVKTHLRELGISPDEVQIYTEEDESEVVRCHSVPLSIPRTEAARKSGTKSGQCEPITLSYPRTEAARRKHSNRPRPQPSRDGMYRSW
jgi:hypothetical protein